MQDSYDMIQSMPTVKPIKFGLLFSILK